MIAKIDGFSEKSMACGRKCHEKYKISHGFLSQSSREIINSLSLNVNCSTLIMIKNIIFDFGGVIVDIDRSNAVQAFVKLGLANADRILDSYHQTGIFLSLEDGSLSELSYREKLGELCGRTLTYGEVKQAWLAFISRVSLQKLRFLEILRSKGYHLYVLSNTNPYVMDWADSLDFTTERKPLSYYFDKLYLSYRMGCTKPGEEIFRKTLDDAGLIPQETLFIDDSLANVNAGKRMGMEIYQPESGYDWTTTLSEMLQRV